MRIGRVISSEITENRDGESKVLLLKVEIADPDDEQTVEFMQAAGVDFRPPEDTIVIVTDLGEAWKIAIAGDDGIEPESAEGEHEIYSILAGAKMARVKCDILGNIVLNQGTDFAVKFSALKAAFDDLQTQWNTFAAAYVPGSPTVQGLPPSAGQSTVTIDPAKVNNVKVP